jgi:hypothetical protein
MKFRLNLIQVAGLLWFGFGCVALYFASQRLSKEISLRVHGKTVLGEVTGQNKSFYLRGSSGHRVLSASDAYDLRSGRSSLGVGQGVETTYTLSYRFEVPGQGFFHGKSHSGFPFTEVTDRINVVYLPHNPEVNELERRAELTWGNILFWSICGVSWLLFCPGIGFSLFYLGFPRTRVQAE